MRSRSGAAVANEPAAQREGRVVRVRRSTDGGFRVLSVKVGSTEETWVGVTPDVAEGDTIVATGRDTSHPQYGDQFKIESCAVRTTLDLAGVEAYLASGVIPGVGKAMAKKIVESFGEGIVDVLEKEPHRLASIRGLGQAKAEVIGQAWTENRSRHLVHIELAQHGVPAYLATKIEKTYGGGALDMVRKHPYRLAAEVNGIGFKKADAIALANGIDRRSQERVCAAVVHVLDEASGEGHVFLEEDQLAAQAAGLTGVSIEHAYEAIDWLCREDDKRPWNEDGTSILIKETDGAQRAIYMSSSYRTEKTIAGRIASILMTDPIEPERVIESPSDPGFTKDPEAQASDDLDCGDDEALPFLAAIAAKPKTPRLPPDEAVAKALTLAASQGFELAPAQRQAVEYAGKEKLFVVTGGPGTGKSRSLAYILEVYDLMGLHVALAAPTGRAGKRMQEVTDRPASTIHRLLGWNPARRRFDCNEENPLPYDVVIIDESSMVDAPLARSLLLAIHDTARVVFIGDVDQLPSVGPGAVLQDLIASDMIPVVRLTQIFRQAKGSLIAENAQRINAGMMPLPSEHGGEFHVMIRRDAKSAADLAVSLATSAIPGRLGLDGKRDVMVMSPMWKGDCGVAELNKRLQSELNPDGMPVGHGSNLRVGDKVIQRRNNYDLEVFNGDVGFITEKTETGITVRFDDHDVHYEGAGGEDLMLAYASTIHRNQGAESPAVVLAMLRSHYIMLGRNLLYTGITRGKRLVVLVTDDYALRTAVENNLRRPRNTRLAQRIVAALEPRSR